MLAVAQDFLTYEQAAVRLGSPEAVRQAVITRSLPTYVELNGVSTRNFDPEGDWLPSDGQTNSSSWRQVSVPYDTSDPDTHEYGGDPQDIVQIVHYELSGWFLLEHSDAQAVARNRNRTTKLTARLGVAVDDASAVLDTLHLVLEAVSITTRLSELYFRDEDIEMLLSGGQIGADAHNIATHSPETRPLSYLKMIRALAAATKVSAPGDTSRVIEALRDLGIKDYDPKLTASVLDAARTFTRESYDLAMKFGDKTYRFDRSAYLATTRALMALAKLPPGWGALPALEAKLKPLKFNDPLPSEGTCRKIINEARNFTK